MSGTVLCGVYSDYCKSSGVFVGGGESNDASYIIGSADRITESMLALEKVNRSVADVLRKAEGKTKKQMEIVVTYLTKLNAEIMKKTNAAGQRIAEVFAENMLSNMSESFSGHFVGGSGGSAIHDHSDYILATFEFVGGATTEVTESAKVRIKVFEQYLEMLERLNSAASGDKSKDELKRTIREQSAFLKKAITEFKHIVHMLGATSDVSKKLEELSRAGKINEIKKMLKDKNVNDELISAYLQLLKLEGFVAVRAEDLSAALKQIGMSKAEFDKLANFNAIESAMAEYESKIMGRHGKDRLKYIEALQRVREFATQHAAGNKFEGAACPCAADVMEGYADEMTGAAESYHGGEYLGLENEVDLELKAQQYGNEYDPITRHFVEEQAKIYAEMIKAAKTAAMEMAAKPVMDDLDILNFLNRLKSLSSFNETTMIDVFAKRGRDYNSNFTKQAIIHGLDDLAAAAHAIEGKVPAIKNFIKCVEEYKRFLEKYHEESKRSTAEYEGSASFVGGVNCSGIGSSSVYDRFEEAIPQNLFIGGLMDITIDDVISTFSRAITLGRMQNGLNLSLKDLDGFSLEQDKVNADVLSRESNKIMESVRDMVVNFREYETFPIKKNLFETVLRDNARGQIMLRHAAQALDKKMRYYQRGIINNPEMAKKLTDLLAHISIDQAWIVDPKFEDLKKLCKLFHVESVAKDKIKATQLASAAPLIGAVDFADAVYKNNNYFKSKDSFTPCAFNRDSLLASHVSTLVAVTRDGTFDPKELTKFQMNYTAHVPANPAVKYTNYYHGDPVLPFKTHYAIDADKDALDYHVIDVDEYAGPTQIPAHAKFLSEDKIAKNYREALAYQRKAADSLLMLRNLFSIFEHIDAAYRKSSSAADDGVKIGQIYGAVKEYLILTCMYPTVFTPEDGKYACGHICLRHFGHDIVVPFEKEVARSFEQPYLSDIMDQISNRNISLKEYYDGIDIAAGDLVADVRGLPVTKDYNITNQGYAPSGKGLHGLYKDHGFKARYMEHDILLTMMLKSMFAKIMTVLAQFNLLTFNGNSNYNLQYAQLRTIYGGGIMDSDTYVITPEVKPECSELYLRLLYYVEFYKSLFLEEAATKTPGGVPARDIIHQITAMRRIALLPTSSSKFGPILKIFFLKGFNKNTTISDIDLSNFVGECNKLYDAESGSEKVRMEKIIKDFVADVNHRYGLVKTDEFVDLMNKKQNVNYPKEARMNSREEYNSAASNIVGKRRLLNYGRPLLEGEDSPIGNLNAPSALKEVGNNVISSSMSLLNVKKTDFVMTDLMAAVYAFRTKLDKMLKDLTTKFDADDAAATTTQNRIDNSLFRHIIMLKTKLASRKNNLERFRILKEYIESDVEDKVHLVNRDIMLYRDLVVNGSNLMYKLYTRIMANINIFGKDVKYADLLNRGSYLYYLDSVNTDLVGVNRLGKSPQLDFSVFVSVADSFLDQTRQFHMMLRSAVEENCANKMDKIITLLVNTHRALFAESGLVAKIDYADVKIAPINDFSELLHASFHDNNAGQNSFLLDSRDGIYDSPMFVKDPRVSVMSDLAVPELEFELLSERFAPRNIYQMFEYLMVVIYKLFFEQHGVFYGPLMSEFVTNAPDTGFLASDKTNELGGIEEFEPGMPISKKVIALYKTIYRFTTVKKDTLVQNDYTLLPEDLKNTMKRLLPVFMFYFKFIVKHSYLQLGMLNDEQVIPNNATPYRDGLYPGGNVTAALLPDSGKMLVGGAGNMLNEASLLKFKSETYNQLVSLVRGLKTPTDGLGSNAFDLAGIKKNGKTLNYRNLDEEKIGLALGSTRDDNSLLPERGSNKSKMLTILNSAKDVNSVADLKSKVEKLQEEYDRYTENTNFALKPIEFSYEMTNFLDGFSNFVDTDFIAKEAKDKMDEALAEGVTGVRDIVGDKDKIVKILLGEDAADEKINNAFGPIDLIGNYIKFNTELKKVNNNVPREIHALNTNWLNRIGATGLVKANAILHNVDPLVRNFLIFLLEEKDAISKGLIRTAKANRTKMFINEFAIVGKNDFYRAIKKIFDDFKVKENVVTPKLASSPEVVIASKALSDLINDKINKIEILIPTDPGPDGNLVAVQNFINRLKTEADSTDVNGKSQSIKAYVADTLTAGAGLPVAIGAPLGAPINLAEAQHIDRIKVKLESLTVLNSINELFLAIEKVGEKLNPGGAIVAAVVDPVPLSDAIHAKYKARPVHPNAYGIEDLSILDNFKAANNNLVLMLANKIEKNLSNPQNNGDMTKTIKSIYEAADVYSPFSNFMVADILQKLSNTRIATTLAAADIGANALTVANVFDGKSDVLLKEIFEKCNRDSFALYQVNAKSGINQIMNQMKLIQEKGKADATHHADVRAYFADVANPNIAMTALFNSINTKANDIPAKIATFISIIDGSDALVTANVLADSLFREFRGLAVELLFRYQEIGDNYLEVNERLHEYLSNLTAINPAIAIGPVAAKNIVLMLGTNRPDADNAAYTDAFLDDPPVPAARLALVSWPVVNSVSLGDMLADSSNINLVGVVGYDFESRDKATIVGYRGAFSFPRLSLVVGGAIAGRNAAALALMDPVHIAGLDQERLQSLFTVNAAGTDVELTAIGIKINELSALAVMVAAANDNNLLLSSIIMNLRLRIISVLLRDATTINTAAGFVPLTIGEVNDFVAYVDEVIVEVKRIATPENAAPRKPTIQELINLKKFIIEKYDGAYHADIVARIPAGTAAGLFLPVAGTEYFKDGRTASNVFYGGVQESDLDFIKVIYDSAGSFPAYRDAYKIISSEGARIVAAHSELSRQFPAATKEQIYTLMVYALYYNIAKKEAGNINAAGEPIGGLKRLRDIIAKVYNGIVVESDIKNILDTIGYINRVNIFSGKSISKPKILMGKNPTAGASNALVGAVGAVADHILAFNGEFPPCHMDSTGNPGNNPPNSVFTGNYSVETCKIRAKNAIKFGTLIYKSLAKVYTEIGETPKYLNFTPYIGEVYELINAEKNISPISVGVDMVPTFINTYIPGATNIEANIIKNFDAMKDRQPLGIHSNNMHDFTNLLINGRNGMFNGLTIFLHDDKMHTITLNDFPYLKKLVTETAATEALRSSFSIPLVEKHIQHYGKLVKYLYELEFKDMANTFPALNNLDVPKFLVTTTAGNKFHTGGAGSPLISVTEYDKIIRIQSLANSLPIALAYRGDMLKPFNPSTPDEKKVLELLEVYLRQDVGGPIMSTGEQHVLTPEDMVPILELGSNTRKTLDYISHGGVIKNYGAIPGAAPGRRADLQMRNIIDLGILPININAMMREIPLANTFNNNYTFDILTDWLLPVDQTGALVANGLANPGVANVGNVSADPMHQVIVSKEKLSMKNPLGEVFVPTTIENNSLYKYNDTILPSPTSIIAAYKTTGGNFTNTFDNGIGGSVYRYTDLNGNSAAIPTEILVKKDNTSDEKSLSRYKHEVATGADSEVVIAVNVNHVYKSLNGAHNAYVATRTCQTYTGLGWQLSTDANYGKYDIVKKLSGHKKYSDRLIHGHGGGVAAHQYEISKLTAGIPDDYTALGYDSYYRSQSIAGLTYGNIHNGVDPDLRNNVIAVNIYAEMLHNLYRDKYKERFEDQSRTQDDINTFVTGVSSLYQSGPAE
jgi:hypothetical protein